MIDPFQVASTNNATIDLSDLGAGLKSDQSVKLEQKITKGLTIHTAAGTSSEDEVTSVATADVTINGNTTTFTGEGKTDEEAKADLKEQVKAAL